MLLLRLRLLAPLCVVFGLALLCVGTALIGWVALNARYGSALELCATPGRGNGGVHWVIWFTGWCWRSDAVVTTDGRQTIVVGGITVATVLLIAGVTVKVEEEDVVLLTVLVMSLRK